MTHTAAAGEPRWMRAGHYAWPPAIGAYLSLYPASFLPAAGTAGIIGSTWTAAAAAVTVGGFVLGSRHDARLCERCIAAVPADAARRAGLAHVRRALRVRHSRRLAWGVVAVGGVSFLTAAFLGTVWLMLAPLWLVPASLWLAADRVHRRYQPWCPWCHWGDDGGPEEIVPDPAPDLARQR